MSELMKKIFSDELKDSIDAFQDEFFAILPRIYTYGYACRLQRVSLYLEIVKLHLVYLMF